jgi:transposase-like protein
MGKSRKYTKRLTSARRRTSSTDENEGLLITHTKSPLPEAESHREILDAWSNPTNPNSAAVLQDCLQHDLTQSGKPLSATPQRDGAPHRPTTYSPELAKRICELVAGSTMTLQQIARHLGIASAGVIQVWRQRHTDFAEMYARAREMQMELRADELLEIADDGSNDWMGVEAEEGRIVRVLDHEHVRRSEVRINTRKWLMTKFAPKRFGQRPQPDSGKETMEAIAAKSDAERLEEMLALIARAKRRVAEAFASGEIREADFEDVSGD